MTTKMLMTDKEITRAQRNEGIVKAFMEMRKEYPKVRKTRLFKAVAAEYGLTGNMVRIIVQKAYAAD